MTEASAIQRELFPADQLVPATCPVCGATRQPGEPQAVACTVDRDRQAGIFAGRPLRCLNYPQPEHEPIPY